MKTTFPDQKLQDHFVNAITKACGGQPSFSEDCKKDIKKSFNSATNKLFTSAQNEKVRLPDISGYTEHIVKSFTGYLNDNLPKLGVDAT